jgi:hypothetical protein
MVDGVAVCGGLVVTRRCSCCGAEKALNNREYPFVGRAGTGYGPVCWACRRRLKREKEKQNGERR